MSTLQTSRDHAPTADTVDLLVIGARNLGFAIIERLLVDGWDVAGGAVSPDTLDRIRGAGAHPIEMDVTNQASVLAALGEVAPVPVDG